MTESINENLKQPNTWKRIFYMLLFAVIVGIVRILLWAVVLFQVLSTLATGSPNRNILHFGRVLAHYIYLILLFLTFNTEQMPFPFSEWEDLGSEERKKLQP